MNFIYVFKRIEKKYFLTKEQYNNIIKKTEAHMHPDHFGETIINNIYFDNENDELIETSLQKPVYKEKLRLRGYGALTLDSTVFFEIKKKYNGVVYKRRISMTLKEAYDFINTKKLPPNILGNIPVEIDYMIKRYLLYPKAYIGYNRLALIDNINPDLRITFDSDIVSRYDDIRLELGNAGTRLIPKDTYLMEIKIPGAMPLWLAHALSEEKIYPTRFSKFGKSHINRKLKEVYINV